MNSTSSTTGSATEGASGPKNAMEKRIAMLERELEMKNRAIESLQEACKNAGAPPEVVQEASDNMAPPIR